MKQVGVDSIVVSPFTGLSWSEMGYSVDENSDWIGMCTAPIYPISSPSVTKTSHGDIRTCAVSALFAISE